MERLNIKAALQRVDELCGPRALVYSEQLKDILEALTSSVKQEFCDAPVTISDGICYNLKPCPIHNKAERTYTESEIVSLFDGLKCLSGLTYCPCLACTLIRRWQSLKHLQVSPYCEKYTVKIDNPTKGAEKNE